MDAKKRKKRMRRQIAAVCVFVMKNETKPNPTYLKRYTGEKPVKV